MNALASSLSWRRQALGGVAAVALPLVVALVLRALAGQDGQLALASLCLLASAVLVALIGGRLPALVAAVVGFGCLNWFFTPPVGGFTVAEPRNVVVLVVFVAVAAGVAAVVDLAARRAEEARRARDEATTLAALSRSVLTGADTAEAVVARLREVFGQSRVRLLEHGDEGTTVVASAGAEAARCSETRAEVDATHDLVLDGPPLAAGDHRALDAFAVQAGLVLEYRRLRAVQERAQALESAERAATSLLRAVSHDLRTPLATMRVGVDGLLTDGLDDAARAELTSTVALSTDRLERLIDDLLDLSRLDSGLLRPELVPHSLDEVLPLAVAGHPDGAVRLEVEESVPLIATDTGLLERVVANLVDNAVRFAEGQPVEVRADVGPDTVDVLVVDHGPGVAAERRERLWEPFGRLDDTSPGGLGLGLAVARGLTEAVCGAIDAEQTLGGGLTVRVRLPRADASAAGYDQREQRSDQKGLTR